MSCFTFEVPIKAQSTSNLREHWAARHKRTDAQKAATRRRCPEWKAGPLLYVRLTRVAPRPLDDDNLRGALKSVRDAVATWLRVDDRTPLVGWLYAQAKGPDALVRVEVGWGDAPVAVAARTEDMLAVLDAFRQERPGVAQDDSGTLVSGPSVSRAMAAPQRPPGAIPDGTRLPVVEADASGPLHVVREPGRGERRAPRQKAAKELKALATSATYPAHKEKKP